jgi:hypothetical protein
MYFHDASESGERGSESDETAKNGAKRAEKVPESARIGQFDEEDRWFMVSEVSRRANSERTRED